MTIYTKRATSMRFALLCPGAAALHLLFSPLTPAIAQSEISGLDVPTLVNGIELVCDGVGIDSREDPRWNLYPLKVEVTGRGGQYLGNISVVVERDGARVVDVECAGPWVLGKLEEGAYVVTAMFEGASASGRVNVPPSGQGRIVLRFPEAGGAISR